MAASSSSVMSLARFITVGSRGRVKEKWGKLTNDDLDVINGRRDQLEGKIQERYGIAKDQVRSDVDTWLRSLPS